MTFHASDASQQARVVASRDEPAPANTV